MQDLNDFFSDFPPISKAQWLEQIARDLKDRPIESLRWQAGPGLEINPLVHADDFTQPLPDAAGSLRWEIAESIDATTPSEGNARALEALQHGVEALRINFQEPPSPSDFEILFEGVYADFIGLHFAGAGLKSNPGAVCLGLDKLAAARGFNTTQLRGSLAYDPTEAALPDWRYLADIIEHTSGALPQFRIIGLDATKTSVKPEDAVNGLVSLLDRANRCFEKLTERGVGPEKVAANLHVSLGLGSSYFFEMARLRAFRLLWLHLLEAWGVAPEYPELEVHFHPEAYDDNLYTNMIKAATMAMSAVLGGANRLYVSPYDAGREAQATYPAAFGRRIARNVQHLLKMESGFEALSADPAAGSYYLETLTNQLATASWEVFKQKHA
ncbi:MAG: hypothetical protein IT270_11470 [Saprospiraceae bacterium]|nr:hypothetical protein [Saprospiraceae bacterium]